MYKLTLLLAALALAATTSLADAAKKSKKGAKAASAAAQMTPDQPDPRLIGGHLKELSKAAQPPQPQQTAAKGKKG